MRLSLRHRLVIVAGFFMYLPVAFVTLLVLKDVTVPAHYFFWEDRPWEKDPIVGEVSPTQGRIQVYDKPPPHLVPDQNANPFLVHDTSASAIPIKGIILEIEGKEIQVNESFLNLSTEKQKETVAEIRSELLKAAPTSKSTRGPWTAYQKDELRQLEMAFELPLWTKFCIAALISWGIAAALIYPIAWVIDAIRPPQRSSRPE